jgi:hypothetical protein
MKREIRFVFEAAAIVGVAAVTGFAHLGRNVITAAVAIVWVLVGAVEYRISRG